MKALSMWQPWSSLMLHPDPDIRKHNETRSWFRNHSGILVIHAAKYWDTFLAAMCLTEPFRSALLSLPDPLPRGVLLGAVNMVRAVSTNSYQPDSAIEMAFGNYDRDRYAWRCDRAWVLPEPIPYRGMQGIFDLDPATSHAVTLALRGVPELPRRAA